MICHFAKSQPIDDRYRAVALNKELFHPMFDGQPLAGWARPQCRRGPVVPAREAQLRRRFLAELKDAHTVSWNAAAGRTPGL